MLHLCYNRLTGVCVFVHVCVWCGCLFATSTHGVRGMRPIVSGNPPYAQYDFWLADVAILIIIYLCVMTTSWEYVLPLTPNGTPPSLSISLGMYLFFTTCIWTSPSVFILYVCHLFTSGAFTSAYQRNKYNTIMQCTTYILLYVKVHFYRQWFLVFCLCPSGHTLNRSVSGS